MLSAARGSVDFDRLLASFTQRWGAGAAPKFNAWRAMVVGATTLPDGDKIRRANDFFNRHMQFGEDSAIWGQVDYWATPMESLGRGAGDCEDFAIAKYFSLKAMGVASDKLRLIYVQARTGSSTVPHMVLAYYAQPGAEPVVLDNLINEIRPASRRPDLAPVFSFNSDGVYTQASAREAGTTVGVGRMSRWEDLLKRAYLEGFE